MHVLVGQKIQEKRVVEDVDLLIRVLKLVMVSGNDCE